MKKIVAIIFAIIFLFNAVGYFIAFKTVQFQLKCEIKNKIQLGLPTNELCLITIDKNKTNTIEWFEDGNEMKYNNTMYDIVKTKENTNSITYYCVNDSKETDLVANMDTHINNQIAATAPLKSNNSKRIFNHILKVYFNNTTQTSIALPTFVCCFAATAAVAIQSLALPTTTPPPQPTRVA